MSKITFTETRTIKVKNEVDLSEPHWWEVTTEGDEEGRTITRLGLHQGTLVEVAHKLASSAKYELHFKWIDPSEQHVPRYSARADVDISVQGVRTEDLVHALRQAGAKVAIKYGGKVKLRL